MTNLEKTLIFFKNAEFTNNDTYIINNEYEIIWIENEHFVVDRHYLDLNVGYITDTDLFSGNYDECLNFVIDQYGLLK